MLKVCLVLLFIVGLAFGESTKDSDHKIESLFGFNIKSLKDNFPTTETQYAYLNNSENVFYNYRTKQKKNL